MLQRLGRPDGIDGRVRAILVDSLYTHPLNLGAGAVCGIVSSRVAAAASGDPLLLDASLVLAVVAAARVAMAVSLAHIRRCPTRLREICYEIGAYSYAALLGLVAAIGVARHAPGAAQMLLVTNAVGYAAGIAARNAGRPAIALGQMFLTALPLVAALLMQPSLLDRTLAASILLMLPAMSGITLNVFRVLRDSITAAETARRLADKMQQVARSDVVTGLLNRAGLNHELVGRVADLTPNRRLALFWLDLDRFKEINDTLGHQIGDRLLAEVGARLARCAPPGACVARFGGDEFIVACEAGDRREIEALATALLEDVTRPARIDHQRLEVGASMGIAVLPDDAPDLDSVMQAADLALYQAKVNGRKQLSFFTPAMTRNLVRRKEIEAELRLALQRDELSIFFQPIIDLATGRIRAFEALVRWFHPEKGELFPDEFIPVAEESGAIITLGNWITGQAARIAATWPEDVTLAVNLSPLQIRAPGAALGILAALREARLAPERLELEVTETVLLDENEQTAGFIAELAAAGVRFALDDFGTGYSSLGYLSKYPFSKIKVDRSFVSGINTGRKSDAIIRAVSGMASTLDMEIVAEGLETIDQVRAVHAAGCTLGQGYYFSRAVPDYLAAMLLAQERDRDGARKRA